MQHIYFPIIKRDKFIQYKDQQIVKDMPSSIIKHLGSYQQPEINIRKWDLWRMDDFVGNVASWEVVSLWMFHYEKPQILKNISHVAFDSLKWISFSNNNIESIQILPRIRAPSLTGIYLLQNNITSISPLRKCIFVLQKAGISCNKITNMQSLSECKMSKQLQFLEIQKYCGYSETISPSIMSLVRFETQYMSSIKGKIKRKLAQKLQNKRKKKQGGNQILENIDY